MNIWVLCDCWGLAGAVEMRRQDASDGADTLRKQHSVWRVSEPQCEMWLINDGEILPANGLCRRNGCIWSRKRDVLPGVVTSSLPDFQFYRILATKALHNTNGRDELYAGYGVAYNFSQQLLFVFRRIYMQQ